MRQFSVLFQVFGKGRIEEMRFPQTVIPSGARDL